MIPNSYAIRLNQLIENIILLLFYAKTGRLVIPNFNLELIRRYSALQPTMIALLLEWCRIRTILINRNV